MTHIFPETPNVSPLSDRSLKGLRPDLLQDGICSTQSRLLCENHSSHDTELHPERERKLVNRSRHDKCDWGNACILR